MCFCFVTLSLSTAVRFEVLVFVILLICWFFTPCQSSIEQGTLISCPALRLSSRIDLGARHGTLQTLDTVLSFCITLQLFLKSGSISQYIEINYPRTTEAIETATQTRTNTRPANSLLILVISKSTVGRVSLEYLLPGDCLDLICERILSQQ